MKCFRCFSLMVLFFLPLESLQAELPKNDFFPGQVELIRKWLASLKYKEKVAELFENPILPAIGFFGTEDLEKLTKWHELSAAGEEKLSAIYAEMEKTKEQIDAIADLQAQTPLRNKMQQLIDTYQLTAYQHSGLYEVGPPEEDREMSIEAVETWVIASTIPELLEPFAKYT